MGPQVIISCLYGQAVAVKDPLVLPLRSTRPHADRDRVLATVVETHAASHLFSVTIKQVHTNNPLQGACPSSFVTLTATCTSPMPTKTPGSSVMSKVKVTYICAYQWSTPIKFLLLLSIVSGTAYHTLTMLVHCHV